MQQTCPDCGSTDTITFIAQVGQNVCSTCGTVSQDFQSYEPINVHEIAYTLGAPSERRTSTTSLLGPIGPEGRIPWSSGLDDNRRINELRRRPEVEARIQGALSRLGYPAFFDQIVFLFDRARSESWKQLPEQAETSRSQIQSCAAVPKIRWGNDSLFLASACCYAVLRRERVRIDIDTVADAAQLPSQKVKRAFKWLKVLVTDAVRSIKLANPDPYLHRILAFFHFHLSRTDSSVLNHKVLKFLQPLQSRSSGAAIATSSDPARILCNTPFEAVEATALDLCAFWWAKRATTASVPSQLAAFAIVVAALEAHIKALAPISEIFRYTHQALAFRVTARRSEKASAPQLTDQDPLSKTAVEYYKEMIAAFKQQANEIPWLTGMTLALANGQKSRRASKPSTSLKSAKSSADGAAELHRRDVVVNALDILDVWRSVSSSRTDDGPASDPQKIESAGMLSTLHHYIAVSHSGNKAHSLQVDASGESLSDQEVDQVEFDCFLSTAVGGTHVATDSNSALDDEESTKEDKSVAAWPRIRKKLEDAAALNGSASQNHPIDLLNDNQVDEFLFDDNELAAILRTDPDELAAFEKAKIAAGDWPVKSERQRNAEFALYAQSQIKGNGCAEPSPTRSSEFERKHAHKRKQHPTHESSSQPTNYHASTVARISSKISLREQQEESDWSD
ncbi:uncharacterized protein MEPE_06055 [Melanopsichium pennsylvanicum]|uniref:TFIIB-type domain-containing protein n=2 Tax=Melanopsichium pennsylvanicum TaxID=63383 RepID=A0AAJ5C7V8_9BASI|nr:putative protein [Melanopsichium pennsylvanicum 4]SNX87345.1 uncharacterized protein MEPE_06055 [Melanopsichium pennsylvanicum]